MSVSAGAQDREPRPAPINEDRPAPVTWTCRGAAGGGGGQTATDGSDSAGLGSYRGHVIALNLGRTSERWRVEEGDRRTCVAELGAQVGPASPAWGPRWAARGGAFAIIP